MHLSANLCLLALLTILASPSRFDLWADELQQQDAEIQSVNVEEADLEDERPKRIAIFYDRSLSMERLASDDRPRRHHALQMLARLLDRLPDRTEFLFVGFNETCVPLSDEILTMTAARRREILQFSGSLRPNGDTWCAESVAVVAGRWPRLDAVFLITDARSPQRAAGERQARILGRLQQHYGFELHWLIVDPPATGNLHRMLQLSRGRRW